MLRRFLIPVRTIAALAVAIAFILPSLAGAAPALVNGELKVAEGGSSVTGWQLAPSTTKLTAESISGVPEAGNGICVTVGEVSPTSGSITQRIIPAPEGQKLRVSGYARSSIPRMGYLEVKLFDGKKELRRLQSPVTTTDWADLSVTFDTTGANKVEVLLRWFQTEKYKGGQVCFARIRFTPVVKTMALVGDSTVQNYEASSDRRGWGQLLPSFLSGSVLVHNYAVGGMSSKTCISSGTWGKVLETRPDIVLIQFGHNDSHTRDKPEATDAATDFKENIRKFVTEARAAKIEPILVTPPSRRVFNSDGNPGTELAPYAATIREVGAEMSVPVLDLHSRTVAELKLLGQDKSIPLYCSQKDRSHYSPDGARWLARQVADALVALGGQWKDIVNPATTASPSPAPVISSSTASPATAP